MIFNKVFIYLSCILAIFSSQAVYAYCEGTTPEKKEAQKSLSFYGEEFEIKSPASIDEVMKNFSNFDNSLMQMSAKVTTVCQTKGCWMALGSEDDSIRVRFKDYGFFVPISLVGEEIVVNGQIERKLVSKELLQHFKDDEGASDDEINAIQEDQYEYTFTASGVFIKSL